MLFQQHRGNYILCMNHGSGWWYDEKFELTSLHYLVSAPCHEDQWSLQLDAHVLNTVYERFGCKPSLQNHWDQEIFASPFCLPEIMKEFLRVLVKQTFAAVLSRSIDAENFIISCKAAWVGK